jgi:hypothetical protein
MVKLFIERLNLLRGGSVKNDKAAIPVEKQRKHYSL